MIFKASFADGTAEIVHASYPADARYEAIKLFPGRLVVKVETAGLLDMSSRRPVLAPGLRGLIKPS